MSEFEELELAKAQAKLDEIVARIRQDAVREREEEQARWRLAELDEQKRVPLLIDICLEALEGWEDGLSYKGEYLANKHNEPARINELRALMGRLLNV